MSLRQLCSQSKKYRRQGHRRRRKKVLQLRRQICGGMSHPVAASIAGWIWMAGRIAFAKGYYTGTFTL
jgi:hypothetical protein